MHVCRPDLGSFSHLKGTERNWESEPMLTPREKSPLPGKNSPQRRMEPTTLHQAGQRAQHTTDWAVPAPTSSGQDNVTSLPVELTITRTHWVRSRDTVLPDDHVVCWLLKVPATCECISGTDLLRQIYVLPYWERSCRSKLSTSPSHSILTPGRPVPALTL